VYYYAVKLDGSMVREKRMNGHVIERVEKMTSQPKFKIILVEIPPNK
jgi:hypothetical protein